MNFNKVCLMTVAMATSTLTWANTGDLYYQGSDPTNWSNAGDVNYNSVLSNITLEQDPVVNGRLDYQLEDNGDFYPVSLNVEGNNCTISSDVYEDGYLKTRFGNVYKFTTQASSSKGVMTCNLFVKLDSEYIPPVLPKLTLKTTHNIDIADSICLDDSGSDDVKLKAEQVKNFTIDEINYLAIYVSEAEGSCGESTTTDFTGIHVYRWELDGATGKYTFTRLDESLKKDGNFNNFNTMEFFSSGSDHFLLVAHQADANDASTSKVSVFKWDGKNFKKDANYSDIEGTFNGISSLKYLHGQSRDFLIIGQRGSRVMNYKQFAAVYEWNGSQFSSAQSEEFKDKVPTMGINSITSFKVGDADFVIFANEHNEAEQKVNYPSIYKTLESSNERPLTNENLGNTSATTYGNLKWEAFTINGRNLFLPVNAYSGPGAEPYAILEWNTQNASLSNSGGKLVQVIPGLKDWQHVRAGTSDFLLAANVSGSMEDSAYIWCTDENGEGLCPAEVIIQDQQYGPTTPSNISTALWEGMVIDSQNYVLRVDNGMKHSVAVQVFIPEA